VKPSRPFGDIALKHRALRFAFTTGRGGQWEPRDEGDNEMAEVLETHSSDVVSTGFSAARRRWVVVAALAGLAMLASSIQGANAATPVRNIDDPGRIAYESQQTIGAGQNSFIFPAVPAGHRLVIQHVSGLVDFQSNVSFVFISAGSPKGQGFSAFLAPVFTNATQFDQLVQLYVDAGDGPKVNLNADQSVSTGILTLTGYLLDCTVAPCAKIAQ
jgi:hypothetical protein